MADGSGGLKSFIGAALGSFLGILAVGLVVNKKNGEADQKNESKDKDSTREIN